MTKEVEINNEKQVCVTCHYMQRILGRIPDDSFPCNFLHQMIDNIQEHTCVNWKKRDISSLI